MDKLTEYQNGNATVTIYEDGTKVVETQDDEFHYDFASSMDICISERCDNGCKFCYANCTPDGKFGRFDYPFLDTIHPGVEVALNLQWPLPPGFEDFLQKLHDKGVITNVTVNQRHFIQQKSKIKEWAKRKLIYGIGVSVYKPLIGFFETTKMFKNVVIHTIAGVTPIETYEKMYNKGFKVLILGYKQKGRGKDYYSTRIQAKIDRLGAALTRIRPHFEVLSFDNLAINQLHVKDMLTDKQWEQFYMGDEATSSFYVNLCDGTYSPSSLDEMKLPIGELSAKEMFNNVRGKSALKLEVR